MTGTISTGSFENEKPFFSVTEILQGDAVVGLTDQDIQHRQAELYAMCERLFSDRARAAYADRIANTYRNIRFYDGKGGLKYPSVTSIIGWDEDFHIPPDQLAQYAARGTIIHKQVQIYLESGVWKQPKDIPEIYPELVTVTKGGLGLELDDVDFQKFYEEYPIKVLSTESVVYNHEHQYAGRADIVGYIDPENPGKWGKVAGVKMGVPSLFDVKTGSVDKTKCMKQLTAYAKGEHKIPLDDNLGADTIAQVCVIHLNKETQQGFSKPILETNLDKYWTLFLRDREEFRNRYGI